jgi:L-asparaginase
MQPPAVRILVTGGTFDKNYDELEGRLRFRETHVPEMLRLGRSRVPVEVETLMLIDSLDMTDADRAKILAACRAAPEDRIVITHGTDTLEETARALDAARLAKTIVLTGAMVPYTFGSSDGLFNLGSALAFAQALAPGTYVAMNGRCFRGEDVRKNKRSGVFEERK